MVTLTKTSTVYETETTKVPSLSSTPYVQSSLYTTTITSAKAICTTASGYGNGWASAWGSGGR